MKIALIQMNMHVGNIEKNLDKMLNIIKKIEIDQSADLIVFPELSVSGYPPEDLLLRADFYETCAAAIRQLQSETTIPIVVGYPEKNNSGNYNSAVVLSSGKCIAQYQKQMLPNYTVFDEVRYFKTGSSPCLFTRNGITFALLICEDIWHPGPIAQAKAAGAECIIVINASPYHHEQSDKRLSILKKRSEETHLPILYCNCVGGQDELVFDGDSMAFSNKAVCVAKAAPYEETVLFITLDKKENKAVEIEPQTLPTPLTNEAKIYKTIQLGIKDYLKKNNFKGAVLGLSGGIDSALTLALAADAIGAENITALIMPSEFTADISIEDAILEAKALGVAYEIIPIKPLHHHFMETLTPVFTDNNTGTTEENLQARIRGMLLMAYSNKTGKIVLTTGNKSEMAVGYCTLYGDMAGGFAVIKDLFKTDVYRLAAYRNQLSPVIPERVLTRAPTAELKANQTDQDKLPPYDILDAILQNYIEKNKSIEAIVAMGYDEKTVIEMIRLLHFNEYKRRQAPIGVRLSERAFGKDWRYPISR